MQRALTCVVGVAGLFFAQQAAAAVPLLPQQNVYIQVEAYCVDEQTLDAVIDADKKGASAFSNSLASDARKAVCEDWRETPTVYRRADLRYLEIIVNDNCAFRVYEGMVGADTTHDGFLLEERGKCP